MLLAALVLLGCAYLLARESADLAMAARRLSPGRVALSAAAAVAGTVCIRHVWSALLSGFGVHIDRRDAAAVFYLSQLGKYVPGSVWPVVAQVQLGARWGVSRRIMLGAGILLLVVVTATGIVVGGLFLPWTSDEGLRTYWWLLVLLPPLVVLLHPRAVIAVIDLFLARLGRDRVDARLSASGTARAVLWALAGWCLLGCHLLLLMTAYGRVGPLEAAAAIGGIGLAWAAGLAFVPAPAGAGVREGVLVLTLGPLVGGAAALTIALASRVLLVVTDVVLAAAGVALLRLRAGSATRSAPGRAGSE